MNDYPNSIQRRMAQLSLLEAHIHTKGDCVRINALTDSALADYSAHSELHLAAQALNANACDPQRGVHFSRRAITELADTTSPHMPRYLLTLGQALLQQEKKAEATATLHRALTLQSRLTEESRNGHGALKSLLEDLLSSIQRGK